MRKGKRLLITGLCCTMALPTVMSSSTVEAQSNSGTEAIWSDAVIAEDWGGYTYGLENATDGNGGSFCASWDDTAVKKIALKISDDAKKINRITFTGYFNWLINKVNIYAYDELPAGCNDETDWSGVELGTPVAADVTLSWNDMAQGTQNSASSNATVTFDEVNAKYLVVEVVEGKAFNNFASVSKQFSVGEIDVDYKADYPQIDSDSTNASNRLGEAVWGSESTASKNYFTAATDKKVSTTWISNSENEMLAVKLGEDVTSVSDVRLTGYDQWIPKEIEVYAFNEIPAGCTENDWSSVKLDNPAVTAELEWEYYSESVSEKSAMASVKAVFDEPVEAKYIVVNFSNTQKYDGSEENNGVSVSEINFGRTDNRETSSDWYLDSKYELMVTYAWSGEAYPLARDENGNVPATIDDLANGLDVEKFADDCVRFGFDTVSFSAWHACMNPVYPSLVMQGWRGEGHSSQRDLLGEVIHALKERGINVMLYVHPSDGHDMTAADQQLLGWDDPNNDVIPEKWDDFINAMFDELGERYGKDIDGYWFDGGGQNINVERLKETLNKYNPNAVYYWGTDRNHGTPPMENWILRGRNESTFFGGVWWSQAVSPQDGRRWGDNTAEYMYKYTVAMSATHSIGNMECGLPFIGNLQWGACPYVGGNNNWEPGVEDTMLKVAEMMSEVDGSINGTRPSESFTTYEGDTINSEGGVVATESKDGKTTYVHVLVPPTDSKTVNLGVPADGKEFYEKAYIYNNNEDKGKEVAVNVDEKTGEVSLTLPEGVEWNGYQTVIALSTSEYGLELNKPVDVKTAELAGTTSAKYFDPTGIIDGAAGDGNGWHTADGVQDAYITIDLKESKTLSQMNVFPRTGIDAYLNRFAKDYDVYLSDESPVYTEIEAGDSYYIKAEISGLNDADLVASGSFERTDKAGTIYFDKNTKGRYLTLHVKNVQDGGDCINISEIGLYERNMEYPTAPVNVQAEANDSEIRLTWDAPEYPGTSEIQKYQVRCGECEWMDADSDSSHTFMNLENGKEYVVKVRAVNETTYGEYAKTTAVPEEKVSKKTLETLLNTAKGYVEDGTVGSLIESVQKLFNEAIAEGEAVMANENAGKDEVFNAELKLLYAIQSLDFVKGDTEDLEMALDIANKINLELYVEKGQAEYLMAVQNAEKILESNDALQDEVDEAWRVLVQAMSDLRLKADKSVLEDLVNEAGQIDVQKYTDKSVKAFQAVLAEAENILKDATLSVDDQKLVDQSAKELENAMDKLVLKESEDAGSSGDNDKSDSDNADSQKDKNNGSSATAQKDVPQTGDATGGLYAAAALAAASGGVLFGRLKKRKR